MLMTCTGLLQLPCFSDIAKWSLIALPSQIFRYLVFRFLVFGYLVFRYFVSCILYCVFCAMCHVLLLRGVWGVRNEIGLILISSPFLVSTFNLCDFNAVVPSELSIFFSPPLQFIEFSFFEPLNFFSGVAKWQYHGTEVGWHCCVIDRPWPLFLRSADKQVPTWEVSWGVPSRSGWSQNIKI